SEVTITTIKITEVVYGDVGANTIEVVAHGYKNPHSNGDGLPARVPGNGGQFLEKGQEYLFFLFAPFEGRYMSNHPRRSYAIDSEGNVIDEDDILGVSSVENIKQFLAASFGKPKPSADSRSGNNSSVITAPNSTTDSTTNSAANNDTNPRTGITLGIIPMFVVGCAALISKNRKK
ncbi:MAG: hypothetical protein FWF94_05535, partial [Oscillospiraceae bacterium]|nr:hypothetical protein [Oscillospiraceae bacterium]